MLTDQKYPQFLDIWLDLFHSIPTLVRLRKPDKDELILYLQRSDSWGRHEEGKPK